MISIVINDVMWVVNFPFAFAISVVTLGVLIGVLVAGTRAFGLTRLLEDGR